MKEFSNLTSPPLIDRLLSAYARSANHFCKLRILSFFQSLLRPNYMLVQTAGGTMRLNTADYVQNRIFYKGASEPETTRLLSRLLRPGDCFVDVGANIGEYSLIAARLVGETGVVVAIEPNPEIAADLMVNRRLNGFEQRIVAVCAAVGDEDDLLKFGVPPVGNRGMSRREDKYPVAYAPNATFYVSCIKMSKLLEKLSLASIQVIKIDVEGDEHHIIRNLLSGNQCRPKHIILEHLPDSFDYRNEHPELPEYLTSQGYELLDVHGKSLKSVSCIVENNIWARCHRAQM